MPPVRGNTFPEHSSSAAHCVSCRILLINNVWISKPEGVRNSFQTKDMEYEEVSLPWMPERKAKIPKLVENEIRTEQEAALRHGTKIPRYLHVASNSKNRWGHQRSYKVQVISLAGDHLPESEPEEKSMSWARWGDTYLYFLEVWSKNKSLIYLQIFKMYTYCEKFSFFDLHKANKTKQHWTFKDECLNSSHINSGYCIQGINVECSGA